MVAAAQAADAVGDEHDGALAAQLRQHVDERALCVGIERTGRLVENQQRRLPVQRSRDAHALPLATAEIRAAFAQRFVDAARQ